MSALRSFAQRRARSPRSALAGAVVVLVLAPGAAHAAGGQPPLVHERLVAEGGAIVDRLARPTRTLRGATFQAVAWRSLTAGGAYVAWTEVRGVRQRIAVTRGGAVRRTRWFRTSILPKLHHGIDAATGRPALRLEVSHCNAGGQCELVRTLDPRTLRPAVVRWAPEPAGAEPYTGRGAIVDGTTQLAYADVAETPTADSQYVDRLPASGCGFSQVGGAAIPPLHDCANAGLMLRNGLLAVIADRPSGTTSDHYSTTRRLDAIDLTATRPAWTSLATGLYGKGGGRGLAQACVVDGAVAALSGVDESYGNPQPSTWRLTMTALRPGAPAWSGSVPQLTAGYDFQPMIACARRSVYAVYVVGGRRAIRTRVVELSAPRS